MFHLCYRLVGCQGLKEEFPTRQAASKQSGQAMGSPGEAKTLTRTSKSFHGKSANKYSLKEELSSECSALVHR